MFGRDRNKPLTFNLAGQDRARAEFFEGLENDSLKEIAFSADVVSRLILSGKVNKKAVIAAITDSYKSQYSPLGYGTNLKILTAVMTELPQAFHALEEFISDTKKIGFDQTTDETNEFREIYDSEISHAIVNEGILLQYCVPLSLRTHAQAIASALWENLQTSGFFDEGLAALEDHNPQTTTLSSTPNHKIISFDHQLLSTFYFIRRLCNDVALNDDEPHLRLRGPTAWSLRGFETLLLQQFITHFPSGTWNSLHDRYAELVDKVRFQDYTLGHLKSIGEKVRFMTSLSRCLKDAHNLLQEKAVLAVQYARISDLKTTGDADAASSLFRTNPPRCSITVDLPNFLDSESTMHVTLIGTMLTFQLINTDGSYALRWTLDQENGLRSTSRVYHVPYTHGDIAMSAEEFETWKTDLIRVSNSASAGLYSFLKQYPGLYSQAFDDSTHVFINSDEFETTFSCQSCDRDTLETAIREGLKDTECEISEQQASDKEAASSWVVTFPNGCKELEPSDVSSPAAQILDEYFVSRYCNEYSAFVSLLKKCGVTESMGRGSHQGLNRNGHKYVTSQRLRNGEILLSRSIIADILKTLDIPVNDFINQASKGV